MSEDTPPLISVLDFRRRRMSVRWNVSTSSWTVLEETPARVHGIALIRPTLPAVCLYAYAQQMFLQIGAAQFVFDANEPQLLCEPEWLSGGLRRIFSVKAAGGRTAFSERYWAYSGPDFFSVLARQCAEPQWRSTSPALWSAGIDSAQLRQSWA